MKRLAVAIIHGIASEDKHYSTEFKHRVVEQYLKGDKKNRMEDDLLFHEIYWGDLIQDINDDLLNRLDYRNELTYGTVRQLFINFMNLGLAYHNNSDLYQAIHRRIAESMKKLAAHRHVDPDETPVVLLAHSFGSVIMSHYIQDLRSSDSTEGGAQKLTNIERFDTMAGFITFGSPLAIYDCLTERLPSPIDTVGKKLNPELKQRVKWLNFYDKDDIVAYPMKNISDDYEHAVTEDYEINVGSAATSWNPACHTGYWEDKDFYRPVANYLGEIRASHPFWDLPDTL
ncbi:hypothetical protein [Kangiella sediminilitoris]|uniref:Uncharacterized protein n=1 Tax=Kangiella sediminilitoris TaxID=1144748 RepID=A0A1B3BAF7_9GAMM|nr:hypothetical protein [Kangiella sediminilitoris]AOE49779.1 hypothetical protein KS2013_1059 [Kangiella sediminilitoris]